MNRLQPDLSVILPTYNESENIIPLIEAISKNLREINYEIIICDDNSPDGTGLLTKKTYRGQTSCVRTIIRKKDKGLARSILEGIREAKSNLVTVMDTDFNHNPDKLPEMYRLIHESDIIVGSRYVKGGGMENRWRNFLSLIYNRVIRFILKLPTHDNLSGFFMFKKRKLQPLLTADIFRGYGDYFIRLLFEAKKLKLAIREIPVFYPNRFYGSSKSQFMDMFFLYSRTVISLFTRNLIKDPD
ncbi:hypothetical protein A3D78_02665 [Candidatus Gottesmanbacteria bacterium RIFCSPHIGHO2_02_FULL_39_14]|uniref:Glycosyltransferase 2-like domain-containing protein n=1 Tax=Candidatus Gottesmanbacteria bacterium RIFCSPHIGHO2_02_FULL_39_14 TaxID=1798383 RepID=A0A1F6A4S1_9BACT|nr:MAG: hypothetical protein A3D78_02665 [Candidatus Gottesmanbacteria bacterium RIFCSPHIGHO2_02_FULL_39_14]